MKKEEIQYIAHLLSRMKDAVHRLEEVEKRKDESLLNAAKLEILALQSQLKRVL